MAGTNDGFAIAERDLELRGPGDFFGTRQSGLSDLKFARLTRDRELITRAREWAQALADYYGTASDPHGSGQTGTNYAAGGARVVMLERGPRLASSEFTHDLVPDTR